MSTLHSENVYITTSTPLDEIYVAPEHKGDQRVNQLSHTFQHQDFFGKRKYTETAMPHSESKRLKCKHLEFEPCASECIKCLFLRNQIVELKVQLQAAQREIKKLKEVRPCPMCREPRFPNHCECNYFYQCNVEGCEMVACSLHQCPQCIEDVRKVIESQTEGDWCVYPAQRCPNHGF